MSCCKSLALGVCTPCYAVKKATVATVNTVKNLGTGMWETANKISYSIGRNFYMLVPIGIGISLFFVPGLSQPAAVATAFAVLDFVKKIFETMHLYPYQYVEDFSKPENQDEKTPVHIDRPLIDKMTGYLSQSSYCNIMLVGPAGAGKTTTLRAMSERLKEKDCPSNIKGSKIYRLRMDKLYANLKTEGDFEARLLAIIAALSKDKKAILFIDEAHQLVAKRPNRPPLSDMLKPFLIQGGLRVIGATTTDEYKLIQEDHGLEERFNPIVIPEKTNAEIASILVTRFSKSNLTHEVALHAVELSKTLWPKAGQPRAATKLLESERNRFKQTHPQITKETLNQQAAFEKESSGKLLDVPPEKTSEKVLLLQEILKTLKTAGA